MSSDGVWGTPYSTKIKIRIGRNPQESRGITSRVECQILPGAAFCDRPVMSDLEFDYLVTNGRAGSSFFTGQFGTGIFLGFCSGLGSVTIRITFPIFIGLSIIPCDKYPWYRKDYAILRRSWLSLEPIHQITPILIW